MTGWILIVALVSRSPIVVDRAEVLEVNHVYNKQAIISLRS